MRDFLFAKESPFALCLFRIGFGLLLFGESLWLWLPHATEIFSNEGFHIGFWSHLACSKTITYLIVFMVIASSFALAIGFMTRFAIGLTLAIRLFLYGIDLINERAIATITLVILLILLFSPSNVRFSVDALLKMQKSSTELVSGLWQKLLLLEIIQVYFFAGLVKFNSAAWINGQTLYQIFQGRWSTTTGLWLSSWLPMGFYMSMAISTVLFEVTSVFLLSKHFRLAYALIGLVFHLGIQLTLWVEVLGLHFMWNLLALIIIPECLSFFREPAKNQLEAV